MGNGPAAIVAINMRRSFPIKLGLMVGVRGRVWSKKNDISLGDIVANGHRRAQQILVWLDCLSTYS
jgi:hypothetical protein